MFAFDLCAEVIKGVSQILKTDLLRNVFFALYFFAHGFIDKGNVIQNTFVDGLYSVCKESVVSDLFCLSFTDKIADNINKSFCLSLCNKLCRIDALSQQANVIQIEVPLTHIKAFFVLIINNKFQFVIFII